MGERTFVTLVDASKPGPRGLDVIEREVATAVKNLDALERDLVAMDTAASELRGTISVLRTEFHDACNARYPGMSKYPGQR